jgi:hypothetical protein
MRRLRWILHLRLFLFRAAVLVSALGAKCVCHAQSDSLHPLLIGPRIGYEFGTPLDIERKPGIISLLGSDGTGTSQEHTVSGGIEGSIAWKPVDPIRFGFAAYYESSIGAFASSTYSGQKGNERFHLSSSYSGLGLEFTGAYPVSTSLSIVIGPSIHYRLANSLVQWRESLTDSIFANGSTRDTIASGDPISTNKLRMGVQGGLSYDISLSPALQLQSTIAATLDFHNAFGGFPREAFGLRLTTALLLNPTTSPTTTLLTTADSSAPQNVDTSASPIVTETTNPISAETHTFQISVHLEVNGVAVKRASIEEVDTVIDRYIEFPRMFKWTRSTQPHATPTPSVDSALHILNSRLKTSSGSKLFITIAGSSIPRKAMASQIREAFENVSRFRISEREASSSDDSGQITVSAIDPVLLAPIVSRERIRSYRLPELSVAHFAESQAGIASWSVSIHQGGRSLVHYSNIDSTVSDAFDASIDLEPGKPVEPVIADYSVRDRSGVMAASTDTLQLTVDSSKASHVINRSTYIFLGNAKGMASHEDSLLLQYLERALDSSQVLEVQPLANGSPTASDLSEWMLHAFRNDLRSSRMPHRILIEQKPVESESQSAYPSAIQVRILSP